MATSDVDEHHRYRLALAALLRRLRAEAGLKQTELASLVGMPQSVISKIEAGERRVDVLELRLISLAVGHNLLQVVAQLEVDLAE